jgi:D-sedoheptulose 7-phosphate isomerase
MDHYQIIAANFQDTIETIAMSVDTLADSIEKGSQLMVEALLADRKVITCGNGVDGALAQLFTCNLLDRFEAERPALPALTLGTDHASITAIAQSSGINNIFSRQLQALGQAGDVLLCFNSSAAAGNVLRAVQTARERNIGIIVMSNSQDEEISTLLRAQDVDLQIHATRQVRIVELYTMVIHCFCELIDHRLFGTYTRE